MLSTHLGKHLQEITAHNLRNFTENFKILTESNLSSWCKNWAISSGVVPSMPCSWRYCIPLFGFLLNLGSIQLQVTYKIKTQKLFYMPVNSLKDNQGRNSTPFRTATKKKKIQYLGVNLT